MRRSDSWIRGSCSGLSDGSYDTHDNHRDQYTQLAGGLDEALDAFLADLARRGLADRVLVATTSEFGRRVADNGSDGLDHGAASVALLAGPVVGGLHGSLPSLTATNEDGNLTATVTMSEYYATIAEGWLGSRSLNHCANAVLSEQVHTRYTYPVSTHDHP